MPRPPAPAARPRVHAAPQRPRPSVDSSTLAMKAICVHEDGVFTAASRLRACKEAMNDVKSILVQLEDTLQRTEAPLHVTKVRNLSAVEIAQLARRLRSDVEVRESETATRMFNLRETAIVVAKIEEGKEQRARAARLQRPQSTYATPYSGHTSGPNSPSPMVAMPRAHGSPSLHTPYTTPPAMPSLHAPQAPYANYMTASAVAPGRYGATQPWGPYVSISPQTPGLPQQQQQQRPQQHTPPQGNMYVNAVAPACALRPL